MGITTDTDDPVNILKRYSFLCFVATEHFFLYISLFF